MSSFAQNHFGPFDYVVVILTLGISLGIGFYHAMRGRGKQTSEDLLMGGRRMGAIPVAISIIVSNLTANTILGSTSEIYSNGIQFFWILFLMTFLVMPLGIFVFVPVFHKLKLTSSYEYIELRYNSVLVRCVVSGVGIFKICLLSGMTLYAPTIAIEAFTGLPPWIVILGIGSCGTIYTAFGGLKAVIWTDVFQFLLMLIGMLVIVIRGFMAAGGLSNALLLAKKHGRLEFFNWNVDPFERYNTINLSAYSLIILTLYWGKQMNVQRYSSISSYREALKSSAYAILIKQMMNLMVIFTGVALFGTYAGCDPFLLGEISKRDEIVPHFFIKQLSHITGMTGLFTCSIFSAVLTTISSALNSLAAITWEDFLSRIPIFQAMSSVGKGRTTIVLAGIYGVMTMGLALVIGGLGSLFQIVLTLSGVTAGVTGGCFLMGIFVPFANKVGAIVGMSLSLLCTGVLTYQAQISRVPSYSLPTTIEDCGNSTDFSFARNISSVLPMENIQEDWPEKLYKISHLLYPLIGTLVTIVAGSIASLISQPFMERQTDSSRDYLHPLWGKSLKLKRREAKCSEICLECEQFASNF